MTLLACPKEKENMSRTPSPPPPSAPSPTPTPEASRSGPSPTPTPEGEDKCIDRWLAERKLDRFGWPEGTMYAGGTPLFDEATGRQLDRRDYIYAKHPEARAACAPKPGGR
jgi:hypothetical protein